MTCIDKAEEPGADETTAAEDDHGCNVVLLAKYFCAFLIHAGAHEVTGTILDDESPAHDLCSYVEELGNDSLSVVLTFEDSLDGRYEVDAGILIAVVWHLGDDKQE